MCGSGWWGEGDVERGMRRGERGMLIGRGRGEE